MLGCHAQRDSDSLRLPLNEQRNKILASSAISGCFAFNFNVPYELTCQTLPVARHCQWPRTPLRLPPKPGSDQSSSEKLLEPRRRLGRTGLRRETDRGPVDVPLRVEGDLRHKLRGDRGYLRANLGRFTKFTRRSQRHGSVILVARNWSLPSSACGKPLGLQPQPRRAGSI